MDAGYTLTESNPKKSANILSKIFFLWLIRLFKRGAKKGICIADLYEPMHSDNSEILTNKLEHYWNMELEEVKKFNKKPNLIKALSKTFFKEYMFYGFIFFIQLGLLRSIQPLLISMFIHMFSDEMAQTQNKNVYLLVYGSCLVFLTIAIMFSFHHTNLELTRIGMKARIACSSLIYRKTLRLSKKSLGNVASGHIVNLLSNDLIRFDLAAPMLHTFWIIPIQISIITYFLWMEVQVAAFAGILAMIIMILPLQVLMGKLSTFLRKKVAVRTDFRVKLMNELITGIHVIKMYVWEIPFDKLVQAARAREIKMITYTSYIRAVYTSSGVYVERTTLYFTIICYYLLGNQITPDKVFSMAQFFNILQLSLAIWLPLAVTLGAESLVTVKRLEEVLVLEEKENVKRVYEHKGIRLEAVQASWTSEAITLKNLTFLVPAGKLCAIVGPVGSGKSSILQLLLGELCHENGTMLVSGEISYASQEPWLFMSSVRQNIVYTEGYVRRRYREIVKVCALERDFELFPQGDRTLVGERGVSLSGGQRARINLARAIYREADIYLLDDPLSAVDTHVANHLFEECISKYLRGKTRILVTHQLQFLKKVDHIIVLDGGRIEQQGSFCQLMQTGSSYLKLLAKKEQEDANDNMEKEERQTKHNRSVSIVSIKSVASEIFTDLNFDEQNEEHVVSKGFGAYKKYLRAGAGLFVMILLPCLLILGQVIASASDYWLTMWTRSKYSILTGDYTYLYIYTGLIVACIIFITLRSIVFFKVCMKASQNLHNKMFHSLLRAPMKFFDTNPSGRVLNRFSRDMGAMDEVLPRTAIESIQIFLVMFGVLAMIVVANYYMAVIVVLLGIVFVKIRSWYISTAKAIKHLEGIAKSPVFSHLSATLNGIVTIRAMQSEEILKREFDHHQNVHTSAWYLTITCMSAVGLWLDALCILFLICITYGFIAMEQFMEVDGSYVGLAISQAMILTGMLQYGVRRATEVVNEMTSVERILDYTEIESEEDIITEDTSISKSWPETGRIEFIKTYLKYSDAQDNVLKNLNLVIQPGEKVGIVGRTGAGKSSIISALFRLAPISGAIIIDGVDTQKMALNELRNKISIIPQEPILFSASVRYNLDPFGHFKDAEIHSVLEEVELKDSISSLDFEIEEGGNNFSVGQRQLICLARAILRNNKILVLDEATANVDHRTDALIQATIRRKFSYCTVLTVAHRLNTIMDSDKILVMSAGKMVEFDHPYKLLQNVNGYLYKMVLETGPAMTEQLFDVAAKTFSKISP